MSLCLTDVIFHTGSVLVHIHVLYMPFYMTGLMLFSSFNWFRLFETLVSIIRCILFAKSVKERPQRHYPFRFANYTGCYLFCEGLYALVPMIEWFLLGKPTCSLIIQIIIPPPTPFSLYFFGLGILNYSLTNRQTMQKRFCFILLEEYRSHLKENFY